MSKSDSENLSQDMKQESEQKAEAYRMKKDSKDKEENEHSEKNRKKEHQIPLSESSRSITLHSPPTPPYTRTCIPPSSTLRSPCDSPVSNDNFHSSVSDGLHSHSSVSDRVPPAVAANRFPMEPKTVNVVGPVEVEEGTRGGSGGSNFLKNKKEAKLNMALLVLRIKAFVFCMISFSVLASDKEHVSGDSGRTAFYWFKEFKYSLSVNVIGFVYSGLQICDLVKYLITEKHTVDPKLRGYFNFAMDQILTYLLMSVSASAGTVASNLVIDFGVHKFTAMANASVVFSYIAFVSFALTSLVSGYILCRV